MSDLILGSTEVVDLGKHGEAKAQVSRKTWGA